jgi:phosphoglycolate phosphatase-like HAD superfamily hydrolase
METPPNTAARAAILDIDGTLVDTNYHHALAWYRTFRKEGIRLPMWRIHRHIGMGGDQLVAAVAGEAVEARLGDAVREREKQEYRALIDEVEPFPSARRLIEELKRRRLAVVLASSAKPDEVDHYLDLLDARDLVDGWTTSGDVEKTKPEPDLVLAGMEKAGVGTSGGENSRERAMMVGDSTWDCESAGRAGIESLAVLTGGFSRDELEQAGAKAVFESIEELCERLDETPLRGPGSHVSL